MTRTPSPPLAHDRSRAFDVALFAVLVLACGIVALSDGSGGAILSLPLLLPLAFRRETPALAVGAGAVLALAQLALLDRPTPSLVVVPLLVYSAARWRSGTLPQVALALGLLGAVLGPARWTLGYSVGGLGGFGTAFLACAGFVIAAHVVGSRRRESAENRAERAESQQEKQHLLQSGEEQRQQVATVSERNRIARELHDIVAHSLSVIVVQAEGGRALAAKRPERAADVLGTIADTSREALEEMRRMVGLLRNGTEPADASYKPLPGLGDIPELVRRTSEAVELTSYGERPEVSPALGLTAYRIVQESLTNVLKHAGPDVRARVITAYTSTSIELEVADDGAAADRSGSRPASPEGAGSQGAGTQDVSSQDVRGHGLQGMHERVALHGGRLSAGPRPGGGFLVRAWLPLETEPTVVLPVGLPDHATQEDRR